MIIPIIRVLLFSLFFFSLIQNIKSQDVPYSQYYSNLVYLNPAFTGTRTENRVNMFYRNQWPQSDAGFQSFGVAYDMPIQKTNSGIGVMLTNDLTGGYVEPSFDIIYSYQLKARKKWHLSFALQGGIAQKYLKSLSFSNTEPNYSEGGNKIYPDFAFGISSFYKSVYSGISIDHLTKPYQGSTSSSSIRLNRKYTFFTGYLFYFDNRLIKQERLLSPNILIQIQGLQQNICWGSSFQYDNLLAGLWIRNNFKFNMDAAIIMAGYKTQSIRITYSYDMNIGKKTTIPLGAHEISLTVLFKTISKKKYKAINCPTFLM